MDCKISISMTGAILTHSHLDARIYIYICTFLSNGIVPRLEYAGEEYEGNAKYCQTTRKRINGSR